LLKRIVIEHEKATKIEMAQKHRIAVKERMLSLQKLKEESASEALRIRKEFK
jgi:hypothetical protein